MKDFECLTKEQMLDVIDEVDFCYFSFVDCKQPYTFPMFFDVEEEKGELVFYVRTLTNGLLLKSIARYDDACLLFSYGMEGVVKTVLALCDVTIEEQSIEDCDSTLIRCKVCSMTGRSYEVEEFCD